MPLHQIIYTSCMRGIRGVNDGQQVFSYDVAFPDPDNDEVKSLFSYQPPQLELGPDQLMTDELARTLPRSFTYRRLDNGMSTLSQNVYLGRDYSGGASRFGNHLSHVVLAEEDLPCYPCELYGGGLLRDHMEFAEVNNPDRPDFLPEPELQRGYVVDPDEVEHFLEFGQRKELFKQMLCAVLSYESARKRLVICDEPENILLWIAAIEYALPLPTALDINFTTYEYDPELSASQICGVVPRGTHYTAQSRTQHFVFDFYDGYYEELELDGPFFDFLDIVSYDSLRDFHRFLTEGYRYRKADEELYDAYRLYDLLSIGLDGVETGDLRRALTFAQRYALPGEKLRIFRCLLEQKDVLLRMEPDSFLLLLRYVLSLYDELAPEQRSEVHDVAVDRVLYAFLRCGGDKEAFTAFYKDMAAACEQGGFRLASQLMQPDSRKKLFGVLQADSDPWQVVFIVQVVSAYVREQRVPLRELAPDTPLGQTYGGLLQAVCGQGSQSARLLLSSIQDAFVDDCDYLVHMTLYLEQLLPPGSEQETAALWSYLETLLLRQGPSYFDRACGILADAQRYECLSHLFLRALAQTHSADEAQKLFRRHWRDFPAMDAAYDQQYGDQLLRSYFDRLLLCDSSDAYQPKRKLFDLLFAHRRDVDIVPELVRELLRPIPYGALEPEDAQLVKNAFGYLYNDLRREVKGKLLLLVIGLTLEQCRDTNQLRDATGKLRRLTQENPADLTPLTERGVQDYFDWLLPGACALCQHTGDLADLYELFAMPQGIAVIFFASCARCFLKQSRSDRDYDGFCQFLGLAFDRGTPRIRQELGAVLRKLSKQRLTGLDAAVRVMYQHDRLALRDWDEILQTAQAATPILSGLSSLFKRKKD